eukprot:9542174-Alexandrium_andersonii.AAC.1
MSLAARGIAGPGTSVRLGDHVARRLHGQATTPECSLGSAGFPPTTYRAWGWRQQWRDEVTLWGLGALLQSLMAQGFPISLAVPLGRRRSPRPTYSSEETSPASSCAPSQAAKP